MIVLINDKASRFTNPEEPLDDGKIAKELSNKFEVELMIDGMQTYLLVHGWKK